MIALILHCDIFFAESLSESDSGSCYAFVCWRKKPAWFYDHLHGPWSTNEHHSFGVLVSVQRLPVCSQVLPLRREFVETIFACLLMPLVFLFVENNLVFSVCLWICVFKVCSESGPSSASESTCATFQTGGTSFRFGLMAIPRRCTSTFFLASVGESERIRLRKDHLPRVENSQISKWH